LINNLTKEDIDEVGLIASKKCQLLNYKDSLFFPECLVLAVLVNKKLGGIQAGNVLWKDIKKLSEKWGDDEISFQKDWVNSLQKRYGGNGLSGMEAHGWHKYKNKDPQVGDARVIIAPMLQGGLNILLYSIAFWNSKNWMSIIKNRYLPQIMPVSYTEMSVLRKKE